MATAQHPTLLRPWLSGLRDYLRADPSLLAIVGARTYLGARPLGSILPCLVIWRAGGGNDRQTMEAAMIQIEAWADSGAQAETLISTAVAVLSSAPLMVALNANVQMCGAALNALVWAPDPDTDTARYVATVDVDVRCIA